MITLLPHCDCLPVLAICALLYGLASSAEHSSLGWNGWIWVVMARGSWKTWGKWWRWQKQANLLAGASSRVFKIWVPFIHLYKTNLIIMWSVSADLESAQWQLGSWDLWAKTIVVLNELLEKHLNSVQYDCPISCQSTGSSFSVFSGLSYSHWTSFSQGPIKPHVISQWFWCLY